MSKSVLILSGSPRRGGNSDILCDEFARGAREAGHTVEKIRISDTAIRYCTGCGSCNTTHTCMIQDDMAGILHKILAADIIVMASPVYFYTIDAQIKTLIDRTVPRYTDIQNKDFYFIVTAADTNVQALERSLECFRGFLNCLSNVREKGAIRAAGVWKSGEVRHSPAMQQAYEMGKKA